MDGETGKVVDMKDYGIWEPFAVKVQTYKTAIEVRPKSMTVNSIFCVSYTIFFYHVLSFLYPTQRVAEGIMFLTRQSVSQSVSPVFLVSATPLKPLNRIS